MFTAHPKDRLPPYPEMDRDHQVVLGTGDDLGATPSRLLAGGIWTATRRGGSCAIPVRLRHRLRASWKLLLLLGSRDGLP